MNVLACHSAHYPRLFHCFLTGQPSWQDRQWISHKCSLMVLEERLAVMNSIHQSESYTALLSFSVKFCLGGLPGPVLLSR